MDTVTLTRNQVESLMMGCAITSNLYIILARGMTREDVANQWDWLTKQAHAASEAREMAMSILYPEQEQE